MSQLPEYQHPSFSIHSDHTSSVQDKPDSLPVYEYDSPKTSNVNTQKSSRSRAYQPHRLFGSTLLLAVLIWGLHLSGSATHLLAQIDLISSGHLSRPCSNSNNNNSSQLSPRRYRRHETSSSITGSFLLFDLLDLATTTGDIDIVVTPQPGADPAVIRLSTDTGTIRVSLGSSFSTRSTAGLHDNGRSETIHSTVSDDEMFPSSVLSRSFDTSITSQTGLIEAALLMGNNATTTVRSETGAIALDILTIGVGPNDVPSLLRTTTQTAPQVIQINPLRGAFADHAHDITISNLETHHVVHGSGDLRLAYPDEWRGRLEAAVQGEGHVDLAGRNVEIDVRELKYIQAHRGQGEHVLATVLGDGVVVFTCGVNFEKMG